MHPRAPLPLDRTPLRLRRRALYSITALVMLNGCYSFTYHDRGEAPLNNRVPIDWNAEHSDIRWAHFWGLTGDLWEPVLCKQRDGLTRVVNKAETDPDCVAYLDLCENGPGRIEVRMLPYSVPLMVLTLGIVMPTRAVVYCSTETPPDPTTHGGDDADPFD